MGKHDRPVKEFPDRFFHEVVDPIDKHTHVWLKTPTWGYDYRGPESSVTCRLCGRQQCCVWGHELRYTFAEVKPTPWWVRLMSLIRRK